MTEIAVIGAGLIGRAWAIVFARGGCSVRILDLSPEHGRRSLEAIGTSLAELARAGLLDETPDAVAARVTVASDLARAVDGVDYVQENLPERPEVKRDAFAEFDRLAPAHAILASSTSAIPGSVFTRELAGRSRCLVAHPVNPPHLVPVVELCRTTWTSDETVRRARALHEGLGMVPVTVEKEIEGFVLNRLQGALLAEALRLVAGGYVSPEDLDKTVRDGLGLRWALMGPFETVDLNAPGGVADYAARYGAFFDRVAAEPPCEAGWTHPVVAAIAEHCRATLPAERIAERQGWRDRSLMALMAHFRAAGKR